MPRKPKNIDSGFARKAFKIDQLSPAGKLQIILELLPGKEWCECHQCYHRRPGLITKAQALKLLQT
jgi:hypothetical protein